jgi:flagellar protein FlbD
VGLTALIVRYMRPRGDAGAHAPVIALRSRQARSAIHRQPDARAELVSYERNGSMIKLHHGREHREIWVNADLIETIESTPDTVLKLTTDRRLLVTETPEEIAALVFEYKRRAAGRPHVLSDR